MRALLLVLAFLLVPLRASAIIFPDPLYIVFEFKGDLNDPVFAGDTGRGWWYTGPMPDPVTEPGDGKFEAHRPRIPAEFHLVWDNVDWNTGNMSAFWWYPVERDGIVWVGGWDDWTGVEGGRTLTFGSAKDTDSPGPYPMFGTLTYTRGLQAYTAQYSWYTTTTRPVPEPGTLALLGIGVLGVMIRRGRLLPSG